MFRWLPLLALPLIAACATPAEVRQTGTRHDYTLKLPPERAAGCMARNAEAAWRLHHAHVRAIDKAAYEVVVRNGEVTVAVATVAPGAAGSQATVWRGHESALPTGLPDAMAKGC